MINRVPEPLRWLLIEGGPAAQGAAMDDGAIDVDFLVDGEHLTAVLEPDGSQWYWLRTPDLDFEINVSPGETPLPTQKDIILDWLRGAGVRVKFPAGPDRTWV